MNAERMYFYVEERVGPNKRTWYAVKNWRGNEVSVCTSIDAARESCLLWQKFLLEQLALVELEEPTSCIDTSQGFVPYIDSGFICPFCGSDDIDVKGMRDGKHVDLLTGEMVVMDCAICGQKTGIRLQITAIFEINDEQEQEKGKEDTKKHEPC